MRNRKQILATLLMGVLASFMILDITGGSIPGNVPATVHAAELESDAQDEMVSAGVFTDVDPGQYYYRPVYWALENDITAGTTPTTFSPGDNCTRAQTVSFLWRMAGEPEPESIKTNFADVPTNRFFSKAVAWAVENGIPLPPLILMAFGRELNLCLSFTGQQANPRFIILTPALPMWNP